MMLRLLPLVLLVAAASAQPRGPAEPPAEVRFHEGARLFADGETDAAAAAVDAGLAEAPADARLRALRELIRQQQEPSNGGGADEPPPDAGDDGETDDDAEGTPPDAPPDENGQGPPQPGQAPPGDDTRGPEPPNGPAGAAGQPAAMSRAEAEALLDAVGGDERLLLRRQRHTGGGAVRPERDW